MNTKNSKRFLCSLLSLLILLSLVPLSAFAEGEPGAAHSIAQAVFSLPDDLLPQEDDTSENAPLLDEEIQSEASSQPEEAEGSDPADEAVDALPGDDTLPEESGGELEPPVEDAPAEPSEELLLIWELLDALPSADALADMSEEELAALDELVSRILDTYALLSAEEQALVDLSPVEALSSALGAQPLADVSYTQVSLGVTYTTEKLPNGGGLKYKFTFTASDGIGPFKYRIGSIMVQHSSGTYMDYDRTRGPEQYYTAETTNRTYSFEYTFKASGTYSFRAYVMDMGDGPPYPYFPPCDVKITIDDPDYPSIDQKIDEILLECESQNYQTDYDKVLFFHDWLIEHAAYDNDLRYASPSGVLCYGKGTCESYFGALDILLDRSGIPHGRITNADHVWTLVQLNGEWTMIDATWDDVPEPFLRHMYFGVNDELITLSHGKYSTIKFDSSKPCASLDQHYMICTTNPDESIRIISDPIRDEIQAHAPGSFTVDILSSGITLAKAYEIPFHIAAYYLENYEFKNDGVKVTYNSADHSYSVIKPCAADSHKLVTLPAVAATCTEAGLTEGKQCSVCNTVTLPQKTVEPLGHKLMTLPAVAATCTEAGLTEGKQCSVCNTVTVPQKAVEPLGHKLMTLPAVAATCTEAGLTEGKQCSVCNTVTLPQKTVEPLGHRLMTLPAVAATCTEAGLTEGKQCSVCNTVTVPQKTVPALGHKPVTIPAVAPDGFTPGKTEGKKCSVCGEVLVAQQEYRSNTALFLPADGFTGSTVWVDGLLVDPHAVTQKDDTICIELGRTDAASLVTYTYNKSSSDPHEVYPVGMKVWMLSHSGSGYTATYIPEFDDLLKYAGSSIRISGNKGIRMITGIRQDVKKALTGSGIAGYTLREYGTVLGLVSNVSASSLVLGAPGAKSNFAYKRGVADPVFASGGGMIQYTNVLVGFSNDQCKEDIVMRPYIVLRSADGRDITVYGGVVQRSIGYIATQNRTVFAPGSPAYNYVWDIIHYVYGDKYDEG